MPTTNRRGDAAPGEAPSRPDDEAPAKPLTLGGRAVRWAKELGIIVVSAIALSLIIKTFFFESFWIPTTSMEPTLQVGDRILVTKWRPGPLDLRRGDIVVFADPGGWNDSFSAEDADPNAIEQVLTWVGLMPDGTGNHLVKRVIGLPGDHVVCCDADGAITVNGFPLDEPYLAEGVAPSTIEFDRVIPEGYVWVQGDNRPFSADSRRHLGDPGGGAIPIDTIVGVAFSTVWPIENWTGHGNPHADADIPDSSSVSTVTEDGDAD